MILQYGSMKWNQICLSFLEQINTTEFTHYNLKGEVIGFASAGRINNLDIRTLNDTNYFFGTNTGSNTIDLWIYKNSVLTDAAKAKKFALSDNARYSKKTNFLAYGICAGITAKNEIIAFVTEAKGPRIQLWKFDNDNLKLMSTFNNDNASESEGCVFDDENMTLLYLKKMQEESLDLIS